MNGLDRLPFGDHADPDPNRLPYDETPRVDLSGAVEWPCDACGADPSEECRPGCVGQAAADDRLQALGELARADHYQDQRMSQDDDVTTWRAEL